MSQQLSKFHWSVSIAVRTEWLGTGKEEDVKYENVWKVLKWKVPPPPVHSSECLRTLGRASPGTLLAG